MTLFQESKTLLLVSELADLADECKQEATNTDSVIFDHAAHDLKRLVAEIRRMKKAGKY